MVQATGRAVFRSIFMAFVANADLQSMSFVPRAESRTVTFSPASIHRGSSMKSSTSTVTSPFAASALGQDEPIKTCVRALRLTDKHVLPHASRCQKYSTVPCNSKYVASNV